MFFFCIFEEGSPSRAAAAASPVNTEGWQRNEKMTKEPPAFFVDLIIVHVRVLTYFDRPLLQRCGG